MRLYNRPSGGEANLVDSELLLSISVTDTSVNVMVIENRAERRVAKDALSTRTVNPVVRLEDCSTATVGAGHATLIDLCKV